MNLSGYLFFAIALVTLVSGWRVIASQKLMHSALWLGLSFFGIAGIFLMLGADFLAAAQVLVYVGAITTLLIFGIMLSDVDDLRGEGPTGFWPRFRQLLRSPRRGLLPVLAAAGFAGLLLLIYQAAGWSEQVPPLAITDTPQALGQALFTTYVIPFEIASVVLLVALIGAIVIALREE